LSDIFSLSASDPPPAELTAVERPRWPLALAAKKAELLDQRCLS
jgi:hypothetical protein